MSRSALSASCFSRVLPVMALGLSVAGAEAVGPTVRPFCDPAESRQECPGTWCDCLDGSLGIELGSGSPDPSVLELDRFEAGWPIEATAVLDSSSEHVLGWSFGVRHDPRFLGLESLSIEDSDAARVAPCGFVLLSMTGIEECLPQDPRCTSPAPGAGYVAAFVMISDGPTMLPGRNTLHRAVYRLTGEDPGPGGTLIELTDRLRQKGGHTPDIAVVDHGRSRRPRSIIDGLIRGKLNETPFHRADTTGDGRVTIADPIATLRYLYRGAGMPACLEAADFDDDGRLQLTDAIGILRWLFLGSGEPPSPGPPGQDCGFDPPASPVRLGCAEYHGC